MLRHSNPKIEALLNEYLCEDGVARFDKEGQRRLLEVAYESADEGFHPWNDSDSRPVEPQVDSAPNDVRLLD